jgi:hypothetical protein
VFPSVFAQKKDSVRRIMTKRQFPASTEIDREYSFVAANGESCPREMMAVHHNGAFLYIGPREKRGGIAKHSDKWDP